jgi:hypothetical protein
VRGRIIAVVACGALGCSAQQWEIGAATGYGIYRNASLYAPATQATAGFRNRFVVSFAVGEDLYKHLSGEFRYTYQDGDPFIEQGGVKSNLQGQSHAFHYDLLLHARPREARVRPFVAAGLGAKWFVVTGPDNPFQPLHNIGLLTATNQVKPLISAGGGVNVALRPHVNLRLDFRDYITPFPKQLIQPAPLGTARGILHQFTPLAGVSFGF